MGSLEIFPNTLDNIGIKTDNVGMYSESVLHVARVYAEHRGITMTTLGTYAAGHGRFFERLAVGRVTIRRAQHILQYLSDHWPTDIAWPADIPRPLPTPNHPREAA